MTSSRRPGSLRAPRLRRLLLVAASTAGLVMAAGGTASAASWSHIDPAGDVVRYTYPEVGESTEEPAPEQRAGDIRRVDVHHTSRHVVIRVKMRDNLPTSGSSVYAEIRTGRGGYGLMWSRHERTSHVVLIRLTGQVAQVRCRGLGRAVLRDTASIRLVVPRACIGDPAVIRAGVGIESYESGEGDSAFADDGLRVGIRNTVALSPPVRRG